MAGIRLHWQPVDGAGHPLDRGMMSASEASLLTINTLSIGLPDGADRVRAVDALSLTVAAGEIVCVVGESGSGKSVTAQAVMGLLPPQLPVMGGDIHFQGQNLLALSARQRQSVNGASIGMIFQEPLASLNPVYRVGAQIDEALRLHSTMSNGERRARVIELLDQVRLPDPKAILASYPHQLSGGQCQRVMIAIALALDPKLLIADEPTTALDVTTQARILALISDLRTRTGAGVLFITHDFGVVADIADRVVVMEQGKVVEAGETSDLLGRPQHPYTRALLASVPRGRPKSIARTANEQAAPVLEAKGVSKVYAPRGRLFSGGSGIKALDRVDLALSRGETVGLVGESGSGKSTLARCMLRLEQPDGGQLTLDGSDFARLQGARLRQVRQRVQIVFQDPYTALNARQKIADAIAEGPLIHGLDRPTALARAAELLALVGLPPNAADRFPHQFSGGQRQRICIARALALEPDVLVADEAVSALDVSIQAQIIGLLADTQARLGFALLFITHDLRLAAELCDRIVVMKAGQIVEQGPTAAVFERPQATYTRTLLAAIPGQRHFGRTLTE